MQGNLFYWQSLDKSRSVKAFSQRARANAWVRWGEVCEVSAHRKVLSSSNSHLHEQLPKSLICSLNNYKSSDWFSRVADENLYFRINKCNPCKQENQHYTSTLIFSFRTPLEFKLSLIHNYSKSRGGQGGGGQKLLVQFLQETDQAWFGLTALAWVS